VVFNYVNEDNVIWETPQDWWLTHSSTSLLLAVLVHHGNPDLSRDPTLVAPGATRKSQRENNASNLIKHCQQAKENKIATSENGKIDEMQQEAKAALMQQAVTMGKVEEVKQQLHLIKEFKDSMDNVEVNGDNASEFDKATAELLGQLPFIQSRRKGNN
jgi:hypothetical protein